MELREELTRLGHHFRSRTDTEVVLYVYEEWGEACGKHFNGMWAYAIWDQRSRQLVLSRDRFGIKPLFIARTRDAFFFASEAKAILASGEIAREPNLSYIKHMLSVDTPLDGTDTPFVGIQQLPAGHNLILTRKAASQEAFWRYSDKSEAYDYTEPTASFKEIFLHAVKIRLRGDVRSAVLLFCCSVERRR